MINCNMLSNSDISTVNKIKIYDDVNSANIEEIKLAYSKSVIYIDKKFEMPLIISDSLIVSKSKAINKIAELLDNTKNEVLQGKNAVLLNETQYKNFKSKVCLWCQQQFKDAIQQLDADKKDINILIHNDKISKHEWIFINWLCELGINFTIICKNGEELKATSTNVINTRYNTNDNLDYKNVDSYSGFSSLVNDDSIDRNKYKNLSDVEQAIYENKEHIQLIICGMDNYIDTCNFYGRLYKECNNNPEFKLYDKGFDKPTYEQSMSIPRIKLNKADYIIETVTKFINSGNNEYDNILKQCIKDRFYCNDLKCIDTQKLFNKIVYCVLTLNNIFNNNIYRYIVYYGSVSNNDKLVLDILAKSKITSFIVLISDKNKYISIDRVDMLELNDSHELFDMPKIDYRNNAQTLAAAVSKKVEEQLFSGDVLGMYKPGQFTNVGVKLFNTTFDEIDLWWNKEMHVRPGFESSGNKATVPTMFKVIKGVKDNKDSYIKYIQKLSCGKTLLCKNINDLVYLSSFRGQKYNNNFEGMYIHRLTDINGTKFENQKPFFENSKLNRQRIFSDVNYSYNFMSSYKQEIILDRIEKLLNSNLIDLNKFSSKDEFIDNTLNILLNLKKSVLQHIQWYEFYTYNPNVVVTINDENTIDKNGITLLMFLYLMGFDVILFIPTCYTSIENLVTSNFMYDTHIIGEAAYNINTSDLTVTSNIEISNEQPKKQGFFNKLFSR